MKPINIYFANNFKKFYLDNNLELPIHQEPMIFGINFIQRKHGCKIPAVSLLFEPVLSFCKNTNRSYNQELHENAYKL